MSGIPVSDGQIDIFVEELLGIRTSDYEADKFLNEHLGPIHLRKDPRGIQLLYELPSFKQHFKDALEEELARSEEQVLKVVRGVTSESVWKALASHTKTSSGNLKSQAYMFIQPYTNGQGNGLAEVRADIIIFTGLRKVHGQILSDHKYWSDTLHRLKQIPFDGLYPANGLCLRRCGNPESTYLTQHGISPNGILLPSTHRVQATYTTHLPRGVLLETYQRQTQKS